MASRNRGRKKVNLRDLSRLQPTNEEVGRQLDRLSETQEPIVTAILGQALIENELETLLRPHFSRRDDETWTALTDDKGPLATFYTKIIAAHAFGIFDETIRDCLHTVGQIRNAFAHSKKPLDFSNNVIVAALKKTPLPPPERKQLHKALKNVRKIAAEKPTKADHAYVMLCAILARQLIKRHNARMRARSRRAAKQSTKYRSGLVEALLGAPPKSLGPGIASLLANHSDSPGPLSHIEHPEAHPPQKTSARHKKGT